VDRAGDERNERATQESETSIARLQDALEVLSEASRRDLA
jgi:hypothetical protein